MSAARTSGRLCALVAISLVFLVGLQGPLWARKAPRVQLTAEDVAKANAAWQEGDIAFSRKDFYAALIKYLDYARLNPANALVYNRIGMSYAQLKYYAEASQAFRRSIELNSKYPFSVNNLGSVFFAMKDLKKAEKCFRKAIGMNPREASFHMNLGSLYFERKKPVLAMAEWHKAMALDPDIMTKSSAVSLGGSTPSKDKDFFLARLCAAAGDVPKTIEFLKQAIADGFTDLDQIARLPDFDRVRNEEPFVEFMKDASILLKLRSNVGLPEPPPPSKPSP